MVYPKSAGLFIRACKGERIAHGVREEGGVKVAAETALFAEIHPLFKVLGLNFIPVYPAAVFIVKNSVAGMKIKLFCAGAKL